MKLVLTGVRMAFPALWEPQQINGQGEPACSGTFLIDPKTQADQMNATIECIKAVAVEKWNTQAQTMLTTLQAKGDICLRDGATKAEYDGFEGMFYISGRNKARPTVLAAQMWQGKPIVVDQASNGWQMNDQGMLVRVTDLPFAVKAPYSGCYVNVSLDVWAQANQYGKRINAKLLAVQFARDGDPFSGGSGFDANDFTYDESGSAAGGAFGAFGAAPAPAAGGFGFGAPAPAPAAAGGFGFGAAPTLAPAPAAGGFGFGAAAPVPAPAAGGFSFGAGTPGGKIPF